MSRTDHVRTLATRPPGSRGLDSFKELFARKEYEKYQRMSFLAQDAWLLPDTIPETLRVAVYDRRGDGRIIASEQSGRVIRPNGIIPCCLYGFEKRDYTIDWKRRLCFRYDWPLSEAWIEYSGPWAKSADKKDWYRRTLFWVPDRESKSKDAWEAYEDIAQQKGTTRSFA